ncbi:MAG: serine/threonine protein kinase [Planctomycetes bacterium]|jgi:tRNA A-37 threonylcarbamoyl transferase component Bud32|nr:serine/threonine protein kinase [Planctomycetota bacterium]
MTTTSPATVPVPHSCPHCRLPLPSDGFGALRCPACSLDIAMQPAAQMSGGAPPTIAELQPLFPDHELQSLLGRGGMGAVYKARQRRLDRIVALKIMLPQAGTEAAFLARFEREARALASLAHPGIVGIHDLGQAGPYCFLVLEYVDGASLRELLREGPLTARDVLAWVPQLCDALQYAHDRRIVHRDIKPENILIDGDGRVRIADFGLARLLGDDAGVGLSAVAIGTPHYMAPEQVSGSQALDHRADLYALSVVIYEMLTGQLPIGRFGPPSDRAAAARPFDALVMKSLATEPDARHQQAHELKREVAGAADPRRTARAHDGARQHPEAASAAPPPVPAREFPIHVVIGVGLVLAAQFMSWVRIDRRTPFPVQFDQMISGWHLTIGIVPAWFTLVAAAVAAWLSVWRHVGRRIPAGSILIATSVGLLLVIYLVLLCGSTDQSELEFGAVLAGLSLLGWNAIELRRMGEASGPVRMPFRRSRRRR